MTSKGIALVTGAGQGIGRAIALRLADDGFDIAVNDIPSSLDKLEAVVGEIEAKGRKCSAHYANVSVEEQVKDMVDAVVKLHGSLDVMVANAGIATWASIVDASVEDWDRTFSVNVKGTFLCFKYAGKQMISQGRSGRMIAASSYAGKKGGAYLSAYSASKFAVRGLIQSAAQEFGNHGITVNAYAPGAIETSMLDDMTKASDQTRGGDFRQSLTAMAPVGYIGTPAEIASLVSYLVSPEAHFITGQSVSCNGGIYFD